jgi:hypothetical protein
VGASHSNTLQYLSFISVVPCGCSNYTVWSELKISIMGSVRVINDDNHFQAEMSSSGTKLVVVDYTASW